jgi:hypothetical protein
MDHKWFTRLRRRATQSRRRLPCSARAVTLCVRERRVRGDEHTRNGGMRIPNFSRRCPRLARITPARLLLNDLLEERWLDD